MSLLPGAYDGNWTILIFCGEVNLFLSTSKQDAFFFRSTASNQYQREKSFPHSAEKESRLDWNNAINR